MLRSIIPAIWIIWRISAKFSIDLNSASIECFDNRTICVVQTCDVTQSIAMTIKYHSHGGVEYISNFTQ